MRRVLCFLLISFTCLTSAFASELALAEAPFPSNFKRKAIVRLITPSANGLTVLTTSAVNCQPNDISLIERKSIFIPFMVRYCQLSLAYEIGKMCYEWGMFCLKFQGNQEAALYHFSRGSDYDRVESQFMKALLHKERGEKAEAFISMRKAAANGHSEAIYNVGIYWENGSGTHVNLTIAGNLYRESAKRGYALAQNKCKELALLASEEGNFKKTLMFIEAAAIGGDLEAMLAMTVMYNKCSLDSGKTALSDKDKKAHNEKIKFWYKKAAAANYLPAVHEWGVISYRNGEFEQAIKYFRRSGSQGFLPSIQNLGLILYVNQCYQEALPYLEKAENAEHLYHAGMIYKGELPGTEKIKDLRKAEYYLTLAKEQGLKEAEDALAQLPTVKKKPGSNKKKSDLIKRRQGKPRALAFSEE